ncbi:hypothetical protein M422DRAFT_36291 [Sphaerobolus stellatus SS14]|uniref:Fe2OG dioxygenase domain-containing protein n=1 Tax=Sphaerobolus stellatus (strain SS14) TaxID=990650 RepID=A0A0C9UQD3_SPHS4|nr:hypothetical protein M422DRAFT_36291 [Sphaerobolus stellatus SS14]
MSDVILSTTSGIKVVDFRPFVDGTNKQAVADAILNSFKDTGFVYLVNHPVPKEKIEEMFLLSKKFFDLPMEKKQLAPHPLSGSHHRGYSAPGVEKVSQHIYDVDELAKNRTKAPDVKESFECGREEDENMPNIWLPDGILPGFKETCLDFFWLLYETELTIWEAMALGFKLSEDYFKAYHTKPDNQLRLLHYPSVAAEDLAKETITRIGAHSDFGSMTLLMQDDVGGLEIENPQKPGTFTPAPYVEGAIMVNAGDFLARWSNDTIRSTIHRVRAPSGKSVEGMIPDRYSIPYDFDTVVDCIPGTWSEENPKKYEPVSAKDYVMQLLAANY